MELPNAASPEPPKGEVTRLLDGVAAGDPLAAEALAPLIYEDLRRIARRQMADERTQHTLEPTALVNEAWLRLRPDHAAGAKSRAHYLALAARVMRSLLIDHARARGAAKRGADPRRLTLSAIGEQHDAVDVLELHDALESLAACDPELACIAELHVFGGMTQVEVSQALGIPMRTLERRWKVASAWLRKELGP